MVPIVNIMEIDLCCVHFHSNEYFIVFHLNNSIANSNNEFQNFSLLEYTYTKNGTDTQIF